MTIQRLSHIGLCVSDLERSARFYTQGLGFSPAGSLEVEGEATDTLLGLSGTQLSALYLERDGTRIELLHYRQPGSVEQDAPRPMNWVGLTHLSFRVADLEATLNNLTAVGGVILRETRTENRHFGAAAIFVTDPDGTRIELIEQPGDPNVLPGQ